MFYGDFIELSRRKTSDEELRDKAFNVTKIPKYNEYQRGLASIVYNSFDRNSAGTSTYTETEINFENQQLEEKLRKLVIKKFKNRKLYSFFRDKIWGADLDDMQLISKWNKGIRFLLYAIDVFSKYACVITLKEKNILQLLMYFKSF